MARFKEHRKHLPPQLLGRQAAEQADFALVGQLLVVDVAPLELAAVAFVQVGHFVRAEQGPVGVGQHAFHEQVGHPVGRVHVVRAAALVTGVAAQLQELLDVQVPSFQVGADGPFALAALVDRHGRVVGHLEERDHPLALAAGALDGRSHGADRGPVVAQAAGPFAQQGVVANDLEDAAQVVRYRAQVAGGKLRMRGAGVEQRGRGRGVEHLGNQVVELHGPARRVFFPQGKPHGHPHPEHLRQLDPRPFVLNQVAVIQRLQAQVGELQIARGVQRLGQQVQVEPQQFGVQTADLHPAANVRGKPLAVSGLGLGQRHVAAQALLVDFAQQQSGRSVGVIGFPFDQAAGSQDGRGNHFGFANPVVEREDGLFVDGLGRNVRMQPLAGFFDPAAQGLGIQRAAHSVFAHHVQHPLAPLLGPLLPVQHVAPGHAVFPGGHQRPFYLVLDVLHGQSGLLAAPVEHLDGQGVDAAGQLAGQRLLGVQAVLGPKRLFNRPANPRPVEGHHFAVALAHRTAFQAQVGVRRGLCGRGLLERPGHFGAKMRAGVSRLLRSGLLRLVGFHFSGC